MVSWQNKTSWLVVCGLVLIISLTGAYPQHSILLLVGALGGLLSRLSRSLDRKDVPTDYGASWTTLFLSPVSGALGAWAGILIANLAASANVLGSTFNAPWNDPNSQKALAIALLFGFSERLLDGILDKLSGKALGDPTQTQTKSPGSNPPPSRTAKPPGLTIATEKLPGGTLATPYDQKLDAANVVGAVKWFRVQGPLPDGLQLSDDGKLSGQPTKADTFSFTVVAADQNAAARRDFTITVA
ncbi:MAG TPA: putative Ig domain-containing protein [Thermoanaerobaculia bacterium]|nr:putative Ig domain-containing protein [Thermoanaerobaculia bacterium]